MLMNNIDQALKDGKKILAIQDTIKSRCLAIGLRINVEHEPIEGHIGDLLQDFDDFLKLKDKYPDSEVMKKSHESLSNYINRFLQKYQHIPELVKLSSYI